MPIYNPPVSSGGPGGGTTFTFGSATINFGAFPGANEASVAVTGQTSITGASNPVAYVVSDDTTADHTANDHKYFLDFVSLSCGAPSAGVGFTIYGRCLQYMQGTFKVRWMWA